MVGGTVLEPLNGHGQLPDGVRAAPGQTEDNSLSENGLKEQVGDKPEHTGDKLENKSCCTYVASPDVERLLQAWQTAPEWARKATLSILKRAGSDMDPTFD